MRLIMTGDLRRFQVPQIAAEFDLRRCRVDLSAVHPEMVALKEYRQVDRGIDCVTAERRMKRLQRDVATVTGAWRSIGQARLEILATNTPRQLLGRQARGLDPDQA